MSLFNKPAEPLQVLDPETWARALLEGAAGVVPMETLEDVAAFLTRNPEVRLSVARRGASTLCARFSGIIELEAEAQFSLERLLALLASSYELEKKRREEKSP